MKSCPGMAPNGKGLPNKIVAGVRQGGLWIGRRDVGGDWGVSRGVILQQ